MSNKLLEIDNVTIAYENKTVLQNFSMQLNGGEHIAVAGVSGCGKSSMLRAILGFIPIKEGKIRYKGEEINSTNISKVRHNIAYLPQDITFPCEWVREIADILFRIKSNSTITYKDKLLDYFTQLGLEKEIFERRISEISGGQRQRVMLAMVALTRKEIILLDEPTSALDKEFAQSTLEFLKNLEHKPAIISVTHDSNFANRCDKKISL